MMEIGLQIDCGQTDTQVDISSINMKRFLIDLQPLFVVIAIISLCWIVLKTREWYSYKTPKKVVGSEIYREKCSDCTDYLRSARMTDYDINKTTVYFIVKGDVIYESGNWPLVNKKILTADTSICYVTN